MDRYLIHKAKQRQEYLARVSRPFLERATWILTVSPCKILVKPEGGIKYIYPFSTLRALASLRILYRQAIGDSLKDQLFYFHDNFYMVDS